MKKNRAHYLKNTLLPLALFSVVTGILTGAAIFLFKIASSAVISLSGEIYGFVQRNSAFLPLLILGAAALGSVAALILHIAPDCRGGGIPSAIAALRGQVPIRRVFSLPLILLSSLLTYLCGVPLGTEGPCVQMGTMIGWLTSKTVGRRSPAWHRYTMTGGACAGFAAATGAPLTGIFFAFEEAHRRFTPMIFMAASLTTVISTTVMELLCSFSGISPRLFGFSIDIVMPLTYAWCALLVGVVCGVAAILFTKAYGKTRALLARYVDKLPFGLRIVAIFVLVALIGVTSLEIIGTGHHTVDLLLEGHGILWLALLFVLIRAVLIMISNIEGVTGGLFIPSLAIGATVGALCGRALVAIGLLPPEHFALIVVMGMVAFLAASSRIPLTALVFSMEALSGLSNLLPIALSAAVAFAVIEAVGIHSFNDAVVDMKIEEHNKGREMLEMDVELIVRENAFVVGKEIRDVLWPDSCVIVSVIKDPTHPPHATLAVGDLLQVHYRTSYPRFTAQKLEELVGIQ